DRSVSRDQNVEGSEALVDRRQQNPGGRIRGEVFHVLDRDIDLALEERLLERLPGPLRGVAATARVGDGDECEGRGAQVRFQKLDDLLAEDLSETIVADADFDLTFGHGASTLTHASSSLKPAAALPQ